MLTPCPKIGAKIGACLFHALAYQVIYLSLRPWGKGSSFHQVLLAGGRFGQGPVPAGHSSSLSDLTGSGFLLREGAGVRAFGGLVEVDPLAG